MKTIDLHRYTSRDCGVFCGRDRAEFMWKENRIKAGDEVHIIIPSWTIALVGTFLCSLVCRLGTITAEGPAYHVTRIAELKLDHAPRLMHEPGGSWRSWRSA